MSGRDAPLAAAFGGDTMGVIGAAKVLVVGAGGIGCELLKNLVLTGFVNIEVIDLDTIDVSNLNRQFLFRPHHVGHSKAEVARESAMRFNPRAKIVAHHGNVKDSKFGAQYFKKFDIVLNALDNLDARRHVNRLCLATDRPLLDSGTAGYLGQVTIMRKGVTECFECTPKGGRKVYPICTIRSTPDKPVHCVVWAKELFKLMFGKSDESYLFEADESKSQFMPAVARKPTTFDREALLAYGRAVFQGLFCDEIKAQLSMKEFKTAKHVPKPLSIGDASVASGAGGAGAGAAAPSPAMLPDQRVLSLSECTQLFLDAIAQFWASEERRATLGAAVFDKDDALALDFVTAAANLRAHVFSIPQQSKFDIKSIAGNIIPAIATTNAIVAGLQVLQAVKVLQKVDLMRDCRATYCLRDPTRRGKLLLPSKLDPPNNKCFVCSTARMYLWIDCTKSTLAEFRDNVLKSRMGFHEPNIEIGGSIVYEEGEDAMTYPFEHLPLEKCGGGGIQDGTVVSVEDYAQDLNVEITVYHRARDDFDELKFPQFFELGGTPAVAKQAAGGKTEEGDAGSDSDGDLEEVVADGANGGAAGGGDDDIAMVEDEDDVVLVPSDDDEDATPAAPAAADGERNAKRARDLGTPGSSTNGAGERGDAAVGQEAGSLKRARLSGDAEAASTTA